MKGVDLSRKRAWIILASRPQRSGNNGNMGNLRANYAGVTETEYDSEVRVSRSVNEKVGFAS